MPLDKGNERDMKAVLHTTRPRLSTVSDGIYHTSIWSFCKFIFFPASHQTSAHIHSMLFAPLNDNQVTPESSLLTGVFNYGWKAAKHIKKDVQTERRCFDFALRTWLKLYNRHVGWVVWWCQSTEQRGHCCLQTKPVHIKPQHMPFLLGLLLFLITRSLCMSMHKSL